MEHKIILGKSAGKKKEGLVLGKRVPLESGQVDGHLSFEGFTDEALTGLMKQNHQKWNENRQKFLKAQAAGDQVAMNLLYEEFERIIEENSKIEIVRINRREKIKTSNLPLAKRFFRGSWRIINPPKREFQIERLPDSA
jgi:hypothetical protein